MPSAISESDGISAVASFGAFLDDILARAEAVKPTSSIEPALDKSNFPNLQSQLSKALGPELSQSNDYTDPKRIQRRFAVIETAVRDTFSNLVATISIDSPDFAKVWNLFDILSILSDSEQCDPALLFWLVEELLDSQTIAGCRKVFDFLESRRERITAKHFKQKQLVILRTTNELLRRLSRALDPAFCGRVFIFMFQSFPLGDKSSVNLRGEYHVENVTTYDRDPVETEDKMDVDVETPGDGAQKTNGQRASSKAAESKKQAEKPLDPDSLYPIFWSLQDSFNQPKKLFDPKHFAAFKAGLETTMATFRTIKEPPRSKEKDKQSEENKRSKRKREEADGELATSFNPKYLTSRDLFKLEISDLGFRRNILVQVLIIMEFLLSLSAKSKEKLSTVKAPNKSVTYPDQQLTDDDTKWVAKMKHQIADYLKGGSDGAYFYRMVETVLSRDKNWARWKVENCPSIELPPLSAETFLEAKASASKLAASRRIRPAPLGSLNLDFLDDGDEESAMNKLKDPKRYTFPELAGFKRGIADDDFEIEMPSSAESKAAAVEGKASKTWRALRIAGMSRLAEFDAIDDDDKIDVIFEERRAEEVEDEEVEEGDGAEDADADTGVFPDDRRAVVIVDGSSVSNDDGRSVLAGRLIEAYPGTFVRALGHVTQKPAEGEVDGRDAHFVEQMAFNVMRDGDQFVAFTEAEGEKGCWGVKRSVLEGISEKGKVPLLEVDRDVAQQIKDMEFPARYIFIQPPSPNMLARYLRRSGRNLTEQQIKDVLKTTGQLAYHATTTEGFYDSVIEYPESIEDGAHDGDERYDAGDSVVDRLEALVKAVFGSAAERAAAVPAGGDVDMAEAETAGASGDV